MGRLDFNQRYLTRRDAKDKLKWEKRLENFWQHALTAATLIAVGFFFGFRFLLVIPNAGTSIGVLGTAAAVISLRRIRTFEKAGWIVVVSLLLVSEIRAITRADAQATSDRDSQIAEIHRLQDQTGKILGELDSATRDSQIQFSKTINGVNQVFEKTREAAEAAKAATDNLTGADAYVLVFPSFYFDMRPDADSTIRLMVMSEGIYVVWDAMVDVVEIAPSGNPLEPFRNDFLTEIKLGDVSSTHARPLGYDLRPSREKTTVYGFSVYARNQPTTESLSIRFEHRRWEFKTVLNRDDPASKQGHKQILDSGWVH